MTNLPRLTFEQLRKDISTVCRPTRSDKRNVRWVDGSKKILAYARDSEGKLEIFLVGPPLTSGLRVVQRRLRHDPWWQESDEVLEANRLLLPAGEHVDAIAATIIVELLRHGAEQDIQVALERTEQLIALALTSPLAQSPILTGLAGELFVLAFLCDESGLAPSQCLDAWKGYERSSRDFQINGVGIEVKTSTIDESRHHIQGWYQVEPGVSADEHDPEIQLYLLSIGIEWQIPGAGGTTIDDLLRKVGASVEGKERRRFLDRVRDYCGDELIIDSDGNIADEALSSSFQVGFVRLYDMSDPDIKVIRLRDVERYSHTEPDTVSFDIHLPRILNRHNPRKGLRSVLEVI